MLIHQKTSVLAFDTMWKGIEIKLEALYFVKGRRGLVMSASAYHNLSVDVVFCQLHSGMCSLLPLRFLPQELHFVCIVLVVNKITDSLGVSGVPLESDNKGR